MNSKKVRYIYYIFLLIIFQLNNIVVLSQNDVEGAYYVQTYTTKEYKAHKQTWSSTQDRRGVMYFGNTVGVLEFDGNNWRLIKVNNQNADVRVLFTAKSGRIYLGGTSHFGYLAPDELGQMEYVSLVDKIEDDDDKIFIGINSIFEINGKIYFAGDDVMFEYDQHESITPYPLKGLRQIHAVNNRIFMRFTNKGLYEFLDGKPSLLPDGAKYKNIAFMGVVPYNGKILIATFANGLLIYDDNSIKPFDAPLNNMLKNYRVITIKTVSDDMIAIGTFTSGLILMNKQGELTKHIDTSLGLKDNFISSIYEDTEQNLWLTGRNISYVLRSLSVSVFDEKFGLNHATYSTMLFNKKMYVGNPTGLFCRDWQNEDINTAANAKFYQLGKSFTAWNIDTLNGVMLVATSLGIRELHGEKLKIIGDTLSVWKFLKLHNKPNYAIACTSVGLRLLEFRPNKNKQKNQPTGSWFLKCKIKGFSGKSRHIVIDKSNNMWLANVNNVVKKLTLNEEMNSVVITDYGEQQGIEGKGKNYVFNIQDTILVGTSQGIFQYNENNDDFVENKTLNNLIGKHTQVLSMAIDSLGNIYYKHVFKSKQKNEDIYELGELVRREDGSYYNYKTPFYRLRNSIYSLNILPNQHLLVGVMKGIALFNPKIEKQHNDYSTIIRLTELVANDSVIFAGTNIDSSGVVCNKQYAGKEPVLSFDYNNILFKFSAPFFDNHDRNEYKFFLEGNDKTWSDWKKNTYREYSNLSEGDYVFRVKTKNVYEQESKEAVFRFTIRPPWYRTIWAMLIYLVLIMFAIIGIVRLSVRRLRKQKEHLEQVVKDRTAEIMLKNDELKAKNDTIESKNKSITSSINYAKRIQEAMLPLLERIDQSLDEYFILFKPRDIVSGDFYWFAEQDDKIIFTAVDCTGHGVPGAFMSMIGSEILTTIVGQGITKPAEILENKDKYVKKALKQDKTENHDGMDMSLCTIDKEKKIVEWAGAKNPLVYIQNDELVHIKGSPRGIGGYQLINDERQEDFKNHIISYANTETYFYIFSDGFQDQFGGPRERKFMIKRLKNLILENHKKPMNEQKQIFNSVIESWMEKTDQTDDILLIGFKLKP